jgi:hypothetical protein
LRNLQIGYNLPQSLLSKINLTSLRLYVQGVNLFTITGYSGLDPEITTSTDYDSGADDRVLGVDAGNYPMVKQYIIGLNVVL